MNGSRIVTNCPFCETLNRVDLGRLKDGPRCSSCRRPLHLDRPQAISGESLDLIIAQCEIPLLVDFYADWCGPCRIMGPVLDQLAHDRAGEVLVGKVDVDRYPDAAQRFAVRGIPTMILLSDGREVAREAGAVPGVTLERLIDSLAASAKPNRA